MKMMLVTALIFLVLPINVINGLLCMTENFIEISLIGLTHDKFRQEMDRLVPDDHSADFVLCGIIITVDYTANTLDVEFDSGSLPINDSDKSNSAILYTTFTRTPHRNHVSELYITCSSEDMCDEKFLTVNDYYQWWWLIDEVNHTEVERMFEELFIEDEHTPRVLRCYHHSMITNCSSKQCRAREIFSDDLHAICLITLQSKNYLTIQTVVLTNSQTRQFEHKIDYTCQFDICNEQSILLKARNITYTYYSVTSMLRIFNEKSIVESTSTPVITQFSPTSTSLQSSSITSPAKPSSTIAPTRSNSLSVLIQSTTDITSTGDQLRVSIKLHLFIFPICPLLFLKIILSITL